MSKALNAQRENCIWCDRPTEPLFQSPTCRYCPKCESFKKETEDKKTEDDYPNFTMRPTKSWGKI